MDQNAAALKSETLGKKLTIIRRQQEEEKAQTLAETFKLPYVNLSIMPLDVNDVSSLPKEKSLAGQMLVMQKSGKVLRVAVVNPANPKTVAILKELTDDGFECTQFVISLSSFKKGLTIYDLTKEDSVPLRGIFIIQKKELDDFKQSVNTIADLKKTISDISTTQLLTIVIAGSMKMEASDIHIEPTKQSIRLRYRIDGILQDITDFPDKVFRFFVSRIKTLSDMMLNVHDISQDGRFSIKIMEGDKMDSMIDVRVSILPSGFGETIVMRLLGVGALKLNLEDLGLNTQLAGILRQEINRPNGMILTTGPTGSGKTTTLYACLNHVNEPGTKIITVENPIEYRLEGITQTQIDKRKGQDFEKSLTAVVRQDPDVLMVGEIRDKESADIAVHFAMTGHLVFSTLHTNDSSGAIPRLIDLGIKPSFVPSAVNLVIAQRLVRRLCSKCKEAYAPSADILEATKKIFSLISPKSGYIIPTNINTFYKPKGCKDCRGLGYQGRVGVFEFFTLTEAIEKLILNNATSYDLQAKAMEEGMVTLMQDAMLKVAEGITSVEEIIRIVGSPEYIERLYGKAIMSMLTRSLAINKEAFEWAKDLFKKP